MSRRKGLIGTAFRDIEEIPEPNRHIPRITAEARVFFPPNASREDIITVLTEAYRDALHQVAHEELGQELKNVWVVQPEGHSFDVRKEAAQTAVVASEKTGRPVDPRVQKLAEE